MFRTHHKNESYGTPSEFLRSSSSHIQGYSTNPGPCELCFERQALWVGVPCKNQGFCSICKDKLQFGIQDNDQCFEYTTPKNRYPPNVVYNSYSVQQLLGQDLHESCVSLHAHGKSILDSNMCTSLVKEMANTEEEPTIENLEEFSRDEVHGVCGG